MLYVDRTKRRKQRRRWAFFNSPIMHVRMKRISLFFFCLWLLVFLFSFSVMYAEEPCPEGLSPADILDKVHEFYLPQAQRDYIQNIYWETERVGNVGTKTLIQGYFQAPNKLRLEFTNTAEKKYIYIKNGSKEVMSAYDDDFYHVIAAYTALYLLYPTQLYDSLDGAVQLHKKEYSGEDLVYVLRYTDQRLGLEIFLSIDSQDFSCTKIDVRYIGLSKWLTFMDIFFSSEALQEEQKYKYYKNMMCVFYDSPPEMIKVEHAIKLFLVNCPLDDVFFTIE